MHTNAAVFRKPRTELLDTLWQIQDTHGYIRDEDLDYCAKVFGLSRVEIEGVASFYHFFHRQPAGKYTIYINNSIVAETKGYDRVREAFEKETGAVLGGVDPSGIFGLFDTPCIGLSDQEPAALINFYPFTHLNTLKVKKIIAQLKQGADPAAICDKIENHVRRVPPEGRAIIFRDYTPGSMVAKLTALGPKGVIALMDECKLRGMGGAFFPVGLKWKYCRDNPGDARYIVCNADEGEPGTFKDRVLMQALPGLMIEGMIAAGYAVGAEQGFIYLRAEYRWMLDHLERILAQFRKMHLLGRDLGGISGFNFDIRIQLGAGSYVCGEETAQLNSMEGKRGEPRTKREFPVKVGYLGQPTVVNNVETFCVAARAIELGAAFFLQSGTPEYPGTRLLSISGDCRYPGVFEVEYGTPVDKLIEWSGADHPHYIQISGPSGICIPSSEHHRRIQPDDLPCGGSVMIFNHQRDILSILQNFTAFFKSESCGVCTPCRAGNFILQRKLEKIALDMARPEDYAEIKQWGRIMQDTSRCGLGRAATRALVSALEKFPEYFAARIDHADDGLNKQFDMARATMEYERFRN